MERSVKFIKDISQELSSKEMLGIVYHHNAKKNAMPSGQALFEIVDDLRTVIFPGYFGNSDMTEISMEYYIGAVLDKLYHRLAKQIRRGFCFACAKEDPENCEDCEIRSFGISEQLIKSLPLIRKSLASDAQAAYEGDPAAKSVAEIIFCYPTIRAVTNYRIAHELNRLEVPIIPRMISELAHSETGIDIHPGATIGERFFIDHGTGVVIGETCVIGKNVRIYQGVTLGAKSFPLDENGNPIKGIVRHPQVGDDVVIYSGATILGTITIGQGSEIGGNVWLTVDVPPYSKIRA